MNKPRIVGGFSGLVFLLAGCSSADDGGTGGSTDNQKSSSEKAPKTAQSTDATEVEECVPEGTKGNSIGVGAYCAAATDCKDGTFCPVGIAPKGAVFCTALCATDADCGEGATCYAEARGKGCVPNACLK